MAKEPTAVERLRAHLETDALDLSPNFIRNREIAEALVEVADKLDGLRRFVFATAPRPKKK